MLPSLPFKAQTEKPGVGTGLRLSLEALEGAEHSLVAGGPPDMLCHATASASLLEKLWLLLEEQLFMFAVVGPPHAREVHQ